MDRKLMEAGIAVRREVLGDDYVDRAMKNADEFNRPLQQSSESENLLSAGTAG